MVEKGFLCCPCSRLYLYVYSRPLGLKIFVLLICLIRRTERIIMYQHHIECLLACYMESKKNVHVKTINQL